MELLITGDTHISKKTDSLPSPLLSKITETDVVIHTGDFNSQDCYNLINNEANELYAVVGNRDDSAMWEVLPQQLQIELGGLDITILHGHNFGRPRPSRLAQHFAHNTDVIIYGHLHHPFFVEFENCTVINPGSPVQPRSSRPSFILGSITNGKFELDFKNIQ